MLKDFNLDFRLEKTTRLNEALAGAEIVILSITTGGLEAMRTDLGIPEKYAIKQSVGDTVGPACASACEAEAYGFNQVPDAQIVGMFPIASMFGEVGHGQFSMPEGFSMQFPTGRFLKPDGSLFLEGVGVQPTVRVPITEETVMTTDDILLGIGEKALLLPLGAGITPSAPPKLMSPAETRSALGSGAKLLDEKAREQYSTEDLLKMDTTFPNTITLSESTALIWAWGWCAAD